MNSILLKWDLGTINSSEIDQVFDDLIAGILRADRVIPRSNTRFHARPFWNESLTVLKKQKVVAYKLWKAAGSPREDSNVLWRNHKDAKRVFRCAIIREYKEILNRER